MSSVTMPALIESIEDLYRHQRGELDHDAIRRVEVSDALVDTGATTLSRPGPMIRQLGLLPLRSRRVLTTAGVGEVATFGAVRLTINGRDCVCDVTEIDDACPVLIGQVPLELLDFVVDLGRRELVGNPAHGGEHMLELL